MTKIVINVCFGGFGLSDEGIARYAELKGITLVGKKSKWAGLDNYFSYWLNGKYWSPSDIARDDPALVATVEQLGEEADGICSALKVVEIPDDVAWQIEEYDGNERVAERHQTWR